MSSDEGRSEVPVIIRGRHTSRAIRLLIPETLLLMVLLTAGVLVFDESAGKVHFNGDEGQNIYTARYFYYLFVQHDTTRQEWADGPWTHDHPMIMRYLIGGSLWSAGYDLDDLPAPYDWSRSLNENRRQRRVPTEAMLAVSRAPMALLAAASIGVLYLLGRILSGPVAGTVASLLAIQSPVTREYLVEAIPESPFMFFTLLALLLALVGARRDRSGALPLGWAIASGIALGLALSSKTTAILSVGSIGIWIAVLAIRQRSETLPGWIGRVWLAARGWTLSLVLTFIVFTITNPHLYPNPLLHTAHFFQNRVEMMQSQQRSFRGAIYVPMQRVRYVLDRSFIYGAPAGSRRVPLEAALALIGVAALSVRLWRERNRAGTADRDGLFLVTTLVYLSLVTTGMLLAWSRYTVPTLMLGMLLTGLGATTVLREVAVRLRAVPRRPETIPPLAPGRQQVAK